MVLPGGRFFKSFMKNATVVPLVNLSIFIFLAAAALGLSVVSPARAATLTVTNIADSGPGTLRTLIASANSGDTLNFATELSGQTITLTSGQLKLTNAVNIDASSLSIGVGVSGNNSSRIFEVATGAVVNLSALTIQNGYAPTGNNPTNCGGGILNRGLLTLTNCTLLGNRAIQGSLPAGGGIENVSTATLTLQNCLVRSNQVSYLGGGVDAAGGVVKLNQCTVTGNASAQNGGGLATGFGVLTVNQCTVTSNSATSSGGGIYQVSSTQIVSNSIVAGNSAPIKPNILGQEGQHNVSSGNPQLAPLGNYGGPTLTMPPLAGSPAINGCTGGTAFTTDQRGQPRILGGFADIGAVEGVFNPRFPLVNMTLIGGGNVQFAFTNLSGPSYRVLASTDVATPLNMWSDLGAPLEAPAGVFTFIDPQATNYLQRFYHVATP